MVRRSGRGKTPENVMRLLKEQLANCSQKELSEKIGVNTGNICRYLQGIGEPTHETLEKLADYFRVSVAYLRGEGFHRLTVHNYDKREMLNTINTEYSTIHAQNVDSILSLNEEENYKIADFIHDNFL